MPDKMKIDVQNPSKRVELISLLRELSDTDYQIKFWINHEDFPNSSGIDEVIHFIFDDTDIGDEAESEIGAIFANKEEARSVKAVANALEVILDELGDVNSSEFLKHPQWPKLMSHARAALRLLEASAR